MSKYQIFPFFTPHGGRKRVYVSGPMSGITDDNATAFNSAATQLRALGYSVCNPIETSAWLGEMSHAQYLRFDFERVLEADFLVALDGWEKSFGALAEILVATRIDTKVWRWSNFEDYDRVTYEQVVDALHAHTNGTVEQKWERDRAVDQTIKSLATLRAEEERAIRRSFDPC